MKLKRGGQHGLRLEDEAGNLIADAMIPADAELICKAMNSHEALVDACEQALSWTEFHADTPEDHRQIKALKAALKLAQGE
jgi:hypothetical protein